MNIYSNSMTQFAILVANLGNVRRVLRINAEFTCQLEN